MSLLRLTAEGIKQKYKARLVVLVVISFVGLLLFLTYAQLDSHVSLKLQSPAPDSGSVLQAGKALGALGLTSPSGRYQFHLGDGGALILRDVVADKTHFSSDTAMHLNVEWRTELRTDGVLELSWIHPSEDPLHGIAWNSNLLLDCHASDSPAAVLELHDDGLLRIKAADKTLCTIHRPIEDKGRLAITYTGYLRSYRSVCDSHREHIISKWTGSGGVDVHVFTYEEDIYDQESESAYEHLKSCLGDHLKTFSMVPASTNKQDPAAFPQATQDKCGKKLARLLSQYHALYQTGHQMQRYMVENAVQYDYILRFRPDIKVEEAPPLPALDHGIVVNIRATYDLMYWGLHHDGSMHTGVTDIAGYGRASAMWTYYNIYSGLQTFLAIAPRWDWSDVLDIDHNRTDLGHANRCDAEGLLGYWLALNGLQLQTDWQWRMGILREDGHVSQGFFTCQPWLKANWMCPNETIWETTIP